MLIAGTSAVGKAPRFMGTARAHLCYAFGAVSRTMFVFSLGSQVQRLL
jgi:hypothetical protein